ncbi:hypothetical protein ABZ922_16995 [Streptomyces shenzhenensis]|uniref:hypothetical protein n=1 Tax=Streptomyces shenzhenensis TaxID=943815 RepID=UPI0034070195
MRRVGTAAAVIVAAVVLTACGGEERSGAETAGGGRSAAAADQATVTPDAVRDDIRAAVAAGDFGSPRFVAAEALLSSCEVGAVVRAGAKPDPAAVTKVVAGLKDRGWRVTRQRSSAAADGWGLEKDGWMLTFVAGTVSEKSVSFGPAAEQQGGAEPFEGLAFRGVGDCSAPSASAAP